MRTLPIHSARQTPSSGPHARSGRLLAATVLPVLSLGVFLYGLPPGYAVKTMVDWILGASQVQVNSHTHIAESRPGTFVEPVSSEPLVQIPGLNIIVVRVKFPPGALSPKHTHPGAVHVYVLSGSVHSQLLGGPVGTFGPGQSFFEPPGTVHVFAENASELEPAEVLATFIAPPGVPLVTYLSD